MHNKQFANQLWSRDHTWSSSASLHFVDYLASLLDIPVALLSKPRLESW